MENGTSISADIVLLDRSLLDPSTSQPSSYIYIFCVFGSDLLLRFTFLGTTSGMLCYAIVDGAWNPLYFATACNHFVIGDWRTSEGCFFFCIFLGGL